MNHESASRTGDRGAAETSAFTGPERSRSAALRRQAAISVNLDSIRECARLMGIRATAAPRRDPAFFEVMDRMLGLAARFRTKLSIYVIGEDLRSPDNARRIREVSDLGHEIGNHTFSHPQRLAQLPRHDVVDEIRRAHDAIAMCTGRSPTGFVAPAWSCPPFLWDVLAELGYDYDSSLFPSPTMLPIQMRLRSTSRVGRDHVPVLRRDLPGWIVGSRQPYFPSPTAPWRGSGSRSGPIVLPLPTTWWRFPVWHTMSHVLPRYGFDSVLRSALRSTRAFYYLLHPADLVDPERDLRDFPSEVLGIERMSVPLRRKEESLDEALRIVTGSHDLRTMAELAASAREEFGHD